MASNKQIEANKINALKAGVKTPEGKQAISQNAFKHGLRSSALVNIPKLHEESLREYESLVQDLEESIKPKSKFENFCIHSVAKAMFKLRRVDALEAAQFTSVDSRFEGNIFNFGMTDDQQLLDIKSVDKIDLILRYKAALNNEISKGMSSIYSFRNYFQLDLFGNDGENNNER